MVGCHPPPLLENNPPWFPWSEAGAPAYHGNPPGETAMAITIAVGLLVTGRTVLGCPVGALWGQLKRDGRCEDESSLYLPGLLLG